MGLSPYHLGVATFNIRNGRAWDRLDSWPFRRRSAASAIERLEVDVIGLQEVYGFQRRYLARKVGGRWSGQGRRGASKGEQCPIVVFAREIEVVDHVTRWFGDTPDTPGSRLPLASFPRIATLVTCHDAHAGTTFRVVNLHLDEHLSDNRLAAITQIAEWTEDSTPTVILGDFNSTPDERAVVEPLVKRGFQLAPLNGGTNHDFTGIGKRLIDHIWFSRHWTIDSAEIVHTRPHGRLPSDHWPVRATAHLAGPGTPSPTDR